MLQQSIIFRKLIRLGSFPECWLSANATTIPKGDLSSDKENYPPISISPILSNVCENLVSHKLFSFCEKCGLFPAARFTCTKGLGCTDAMLSIYHHHQKSIDAGMEFYIVQIDFSAAIDRNLHSGLLFKLKFIDIDGSVMSICTEFLYDHRQRVVVDGGACEWIPLISGVPRGSVLGSLLFILYTSEMFELVGNRLFAYVDDSTVLAVVRKPADRHAVAASLDGDLARIQEWCNHWCMMQNPNKIKATVVSRSRTVSSPQGDLVFLGVSIRASPNLDILGVQFDSKLTFKDHVRGIVSRVSQRISILR